MEKLTSMSHADGLRQKSKPYLVYQSFSLCLHITQQAADRILSYENINKNKKTKTKK